MEKRKKFLIIFGRKDIERIKSPLDFGRKGEKRWIEKKSLKRLLGYLKVKEQKRLLSLVLM
jgi:hypothetical protein